MIRDNRRINIQTNFFDQEEYYAPKHIQDTFESILLNKQKGAIAMYNVMDTFRLSKLVNAFNTLRAPLRIRKYSSKVLFMRDTSQHKRSSVSQSGVFKEDPNQEEELEFDEIKRKYSARYNNKKRSQSVGSVLSKQSNYLRQSRKRILQGIHKKLQQKQEQASQEKSREKSKRGLKFHSLHEKQKQVYEQKNNKTESKETVQINRRIQKLEHLMKNIRRQKQKKQPVIIHQKKTVAQLPKREKNIQKMRLFIDEIQNLRKQVEQVKQINQTILRHSKSRTNRSSGSEKSQYHSHSDRISLVNPIKRSQVISSNHINKTQRLNSSLFINKNAEIDVNKRTKSNVKSSDKNKRETSYKKQVKILDDRQDPRSSRRRVQEKLNKKQKQLRQKLRERQKERQKLRERQQHLRRKQQQKSRKNSKEKQDLKLKLETIQQKNIFRSSQKERGKKQTSIQKNRKASKQASRQASKHISKQASKQHLKLEQIAQTRKPQSRQRLKRQPSVTQSEEQQLYRSAMNQARKDMRQHKIKIAGNKPWDQEQQFIKRGEEEYIRVQDAGYPHDPLGMGKISMKKQQNKIYTNPSGSINQGIASSNKHKNEPEVVNRNEAEEHKQKEWYLEYGSPKYNFEPKHASNFENQYKEAGNAYQYGHGTNQYNHPIQTTQHNPYNQYNEYNQKQGSQVRQKDSPNPIGMYAPNTNMKTNMNTNMSSLQKPNKYRIENLYQANEVADTISRSNVHSNISSPNSNNKPVSPFSYRSYGYNTGGYNKNTFNNAYHSNPVSARDKSAENEEHYQDSYEHSKPYGEYNYNYGTYGAYESSNKEDAKNSPNQYEGGYGYGTSVNYSAGNTQGYTNPQLLKELNIKPFGKSRENSYEPTQAHKYDGGSYQSPYVSSNTNAKSNTNSINNSLNNSNTVSKNSAYSHNYNNLLSLDTLQQIGNKANINSNSGSEHLSNTRYSHRNNNNRDRDGDRDRDNNKQSKDDDIKLISYNTISDNNSYNSYTYSKGSSKAITSMNKLEQEYNSIMRGDTADIHRNKDVTLHANQINTNANTNTNTNTNTSYNYGDDTITYEHGAYPYPYAYNYDILPNPSNYDEEDPKNYLKKNNAEDQATFSFAARSNPAGSSRQASREGSRTSGQAADTYAYEYKFKSNNVDPSTKLPSLNLDSIRHQDTNISTTNAQKYLSNKATPYAYEEFYKGYAKGN